MREQLIAKGPSDTETNRSAKTDTNRKGDMGGKQKVRTKEVGNCQRGTKNSVEEE